MTNASFQVPTLSFSGLKELRKRLFFVMIALVVYRIGAYISVPGLDPERLALLLNQTASSGLLAHWNMLSGGSLSRFSVCALGLSPYISTSILLDILSLSIPSLEKLKKEGELGQRKLNQYTRYGTVGLSFVYGFSLTKLLVSYYRVVTDPNPSFYMIAVITLVAGSVFLMWLGEQITDRGVGNGSSIIIFAGIVAGLPQAIFQLIERMRQGQVPIVTLLVIVAIISSVTSFVVFMERAQRKITVHYPKRQQGRHVYAAQSSYLALKINMSGIMPTIFAFNVMMIPAIFWGWLNISEKYPIFKTIELLFSKGQPLYMLVFAASIIFFSFFYTALKFDPREMADNLKKSGAFIPGVRPGEQSGQYIDRIMTRLTLIGCFYLLLVVLLPDLMETHLKIPLAFGGTALLIVVVVVMELMTQIQSLLMSHQYPSLLKKARLKGNLSIR
jgi:preprotein translocase subunit SecY